MRHARGSACAGSPRAARWGFGAAALAAWWLTACGTARAPSGGESSAGDTPSARASGGGATVVVTLATGSADVVEAPALAQPPHETPELRGLVLGTTASGALLSDGTAALWGESFYPFYGAALEAGQGRSEEPVRVAGLAGVRQIGLGTFFGCALRDDGAIVCWGDEGTRFGFTDSQPRYQPVAIPGAQKAKAIAVGTGSVCALGAGGGVTCWGHAALGVAAPLPRYGPAHVAGLDDAVEIACGHAHACARRASGEVACWGRNRAGELGDGTLAERATPVRVHGLPGKAVELALSGASEEPPELLGIGSFTCARLDDGTVACFGNDDHGELGDGKRSPRARPARIDGLHDAIGLTAGTNHACALVAEGAAGGSVRCWGRNHGGQLGDGTTETRRTPVAVLDLPRAGGHHTCARTESGRVYCWGLGLRGELGAGKGWSSATPREVSGALWRMR